MLERETIVAYRHVIDYCVGEELGTMGETLFNIFNTTGCDPLVAQVSVDNIPYTIYLSVVD